MPTDSQRGCFPAALLLAILLVLFSTNYMTRGEAARTPSGYDYTLLSGNNGSLAELFGEEEFLMESEASQRLLGGNDPDVFGTLHKQQWCNEKLYKGCSSPAPGKIKDCIGTYCRSPR